MKLKVLNESYNPLFQRKELRIEIEHDSKGTPDRPTLKKFVSSKMQIDEGRIYVIGIKTLTGVNKSICEIECFDDKLRGEHVVPLHLRERGVKKPSEAEKGVKKPSEAEKGVKKPSEAE